MNRNTNRACLIGDRSGDGLTNPPRCISREFVATAPFELVDRLHQTDVAFLNQIEELQAPVGIFLRNRNDQTEIGFHQFTLGLARLMFAGDDGLERSFDFDRRDVMFLLDCLQTLLAVRNVLLISLDVIRFEALLGQAVRVSVNLPFG